MPHFSSWAKQSTRCVVPALQKDIQTERFCVGSGDRHRTERFIQEKTVVSNSKTLGRCLVVPPLPPPILEELDKHHCISVL